jgi:hypothetical protein
VTHGSVSVMKLGYRTGRRVKEAPSINGCIRCEV